MATTKYDPNPVHFNNTFMHLTNPDINKKFKPYADNPRPWYDDYDDYVHNNINLFLITSNEKRTEETRREQECRSLPYCVL
jgi:hypothetical protein